MANAASAEPSPPRPRTIERARTTVAPDAPGCTIPGLPLHRLSITRCQKEATYPAGANPITSRTFYTIAAIVVLLVEAAIAAFVHDAFVRPWLGDSLAVVLVYLALRSTTRLSVGWSTGAAFAIACAIEVGQYYHLVDLLGLGHYRLARVLLGVGFDPCDFLAYAAGAAATLVTEGATRRPVSGSCGRP